MSLLEKLTERQTKILVLKGEAFDVSRRQALLKREFDALDELRNNKIQELNKLEKEELAERTSTSSIPDKENVDSKEAE